MWHLVSILDRIIVEWKSKNIPEIEIIKTQEF